MAIDSDALHISRIKRETSKRIEMMTESSMQKQQRQKWKL
jgi:hypothetical protein